jgi:hypothetical protein
VRGDFGSHPACTPGLTLELGEPVPLFIWILAKQTLLVILQIKTKGIAYNSSNKKKGKEKIALQLAAKQRHMRQVQAFPCMNTSQ